MTDIQITTEGHHYLGGGIGSEALDFSSEVNFGHPEIADS